MEQEESVIIEKLEEKGYDMDPVEKSYNYLLRLPIRTFTADKVRSLKKDIEGLEKQLSTLKTTKIETMWKRELKELETEYIKWLKVMESRVPKKRKTKGKK